MKNYRISNRKMKECSFMEVLVSVHLGFDRQVPVYNPLVFCLLCNLRKCAMINLFFFNK